LGTPRGHLLGLCDHEALSSRHHRSKQIVRRLGTVVFLLQLLGVAAAAIRPGDRLLVLPTGILLSGVTLLVGLVVGSEIGLAVALGWLGLSFAASLGVRGILTNPFASWFLLILGGAPLSPLALALRKAVHLGTGVGLIVVCALLLGRRCWRGLSRWATEERRGPRGAPS